MSSARNNKNGNCGPFEVVFGDSEGAVPAVSAGTSSVAPVVVCGDQEPERRYDCSNYESCLKVAAALNWESFTCASCCGQIDENLQWRSCLNTRKDAVAKAICGRPHLLSHAVSKASPASTPLTAPLLTAVSDVLLPKKTLA
jgi:hypothetical protein